VDLEGVEVEAGINIDDEDLDRGIVGVSIFSLLLMGGIERGTE
jgi:hypothetical protein